MGRVSERSDNLHYSLILVGRIKKDGSSLFPAGQNPIHSPGNGYRLHHYRVYYRDGPAEQRR
jgi:hypothetical protein